MIEINGIQLEFDMLDANTAERYEDANLTLQKQLAAMNLETMRTADAIRKQCQIVFDYFDCIFGTGTSDTIFAGKMHLGECLDALEIVTNASTAQSKAFEERFSRYRPNRAQRRSKV